MKKKTEWSPENNNPEFASYVVAGINSHAVNIPGTKTSAMKKNIKYYLDGLKSGDRSVLAQVITIIESNSVKHFNLAQEIISANLNTEKKSIRIGITGAPGSGKSTLIDVFGSYLCSIGHKVAVLAIDPSSSVTKGSILGDKTRMEKLSRHPNSFIRPSPSGDALGGVARKTRESIYACEAAGYDIIIIETIGVGQSEIVVRSMVDFFLLILMPGEGDELQGIKKGTVELADAIIINKADGDNLKLAELTKNQYAQALHYTRQATEGWDTKILTASAIEETGIKDIYDLILTFVQQTQSSQQFHERRNKQLVNWLHAMINSRLADIFYTNENIKSQLSHYQKQILNGEITVSNAVNLLMDSFLNDNKRRT